MNTTAADTVAAARFAFDEAPIVPAAELQRGDRLHHWSPTGGVWKVDAILRDGRFRLVSDMGAVRYFTAAALDEKGARLHSRAAS